MSWWWKEKIHRIWELLFGIKLQRDILPRVESLNTVWVPCSFSYLPIESYSYQEVDHTLKEYLGLIDTVAQQNKISWKNNDITIKLYQFWQYRFPDYFRSKIVELVEHAHMKGVFLWFDTSDRVVYEVRNIIDETITVFEDIYRKVKGGGDKPLLWICFQSYHHRTDQDMEYCINKGYVVRLVKWFYADGDIRDWREVTSHYETLAKKYLVSPLLEYLAIATHDKPMIDRLLRYVDEQNIDRTKFSIQWFRGIQDQYYVDLRDQGYQIKMYIPYGNFLKFVWRWGKWMDTKRILRRIIGMKII